MDDEALYEARLELVDFLVAVFWDAPAESFLARLLGDDVRLPDDPVNEPMDEGFKMLREWRDTNRERAIEAVHDEVSREYTDLFVGPRPPVLPHETYYRDDTEFIGDGLSAVEESYAAVGWSPPEEYPEESDFVAVELSFLRTLIERQRAGEPEAFGYERVFLDEHLLTWVDPFVADVHETADPGLFRAAAAVFDGLVDFEDELVAQVVPD